MNIRIALLAAIPLMAPALPAMPERPAEAAATDPLSDGPHHVVVNGVRLHYEVAGKAVAGQAPVVFLHGGPGQGSQAFAAEAGPLLEPELRLIYLDQRGSGRSERPWTREYSLPILVDDLEALRQRLGLERIALLGHSFGTALALEYAARYPERVSALALAAAIPDMPETIRGLCARLAETHPAAFARAEKDDPQEPCDIFGALLGDEKEAFFLANMFPDPSVAERLAAIDEGLGLRNTGELSEAIFAGGLLEYRFDQHERLTMPTLALAGRLDYQTGLKAPRALVEQLPNARLHILDTSGHFMWMDQPEEFSRAVAGFFNSRATRP